MSDQITILNSTISNFDEISKNLSHNQIILETRIQEVESTINNIFVNEANNYQYFLTYSILTQLTFLFQNIYDILEQIEIASTFAKLNTLHNSIINPFDLLKEIKATSKLLTDTQLPFEPEIDNILKYEKIINIKGYSKGFTVIFMLEIPLAEKENFQFFEMYTLPVKIDLTYQLLLPKTKFLALGNKHYVFINNNCIYINPNEYLCKDVNPVLINEKAAPCEVALLSFYPDLSDCHLINIDITELQIQKLKSNKWIIISPNEVTITQTCNKIVAKIQIQGTFVITLNKECKIMIKNQLLQTHTLSPYNEKFELPKLNFTFANISKINYHPGPLQIETINSHKILETQNSLIKQSQRIKDIDTTPISYNTSIWTIIMYIIFICVVLYIIYNKIVKFIRNKNKNCKALPTENSDIII